MTGFIDNAAGNKISVRRVDASSVTSPIQIYAEAPDNASVVAFKNKLSESAEYGDVSVPLLGIKELDNGSVGFNLSFSLKEGVVSR